MAKVYCAICEGKVNALTKVKLKNDEIICSNCLASVVSFKEQTKRGNADFTLDEIKGRIEEKTVMKARKKEGKSKIHSINENISIIENFDVDNNDPEMKDVKERMKLRTNVLKERLATEDLNEKEITEIDKELKQYAKGVKQSQFWGGLGDKFQSGGEKLERTGKKIQKAGYHTTAAVWTPALYVGYRVIKKNKKDKTNDAITSPEEHLINFIKECEQGYKDGKIDEETMKKYIVDFTNNYYRNESLDS